ncbi:MAG: hypothetical protein IKL82_06320 [Clostridia bacterium]|nr:hypothetical protein [Clostridia bacterium]
MGENKNKKDDVVVVEKKLADATVVKEQYVICEVCGHANKATNAQCEMCSNYLR